MSIRYNELRQKEVVNICDGRRLGCVCDAVLNKCGQIEALVVPGQCGMFSFIRSGKETVIPWCRIVRLGDDVILVDIDGVPVKKG